MTSIPSICLAISLVEFLLQFGQASALGTRTEPSAGRAMVPSGVTRHDLALAADARPAVDRRPQVFQLRVDLQRRDGDRGHLVVLLVHLFERVAELRHGAARGVDLAQQAERDRAVGLDQQVAVELASVNDSTRTSSPTFSR